MVVKAWGEAAGVKGVVKETAEVAGVRAWTGRVDVARQRLPRVRMCVEGCTEHPLPASCTCTFRQAASSAGVFAKKPVPVSPFVHTHTPHTKQSCMQLPQGRTWEDGGRGGFEEDWAEG